MALLDFIELSDDEEIVVSKKNDEEIVDLSSDDETVEESHNDLTCGSPGQHPTTLHDGQAVFVAEGEGETIQSGNVDESTPSSSVSEKGSLGTAALQNCPHTPTEISLPCPASAKALTFKACDANLLRVKVKRRRKLFHSDTLWRSPRLEAKNKGKSVVELAVDLKRSRMRMPEEQDTSSASGNCSHTPAAVTFPSPTSISAKALKACDANLPRVEKKRRRKLVRAWRSPRLEDKNKGRNKSAVELAVDLKRSGMLEEQNTSARSQKKNKLPLCIRCRITSGLWAFEAL